MTVISARPAAWTQSVTVRRLRSPDLDPIPQNVWIHRARRSPPLLAARASARAEEPAGLLSEPG